MADPRRARRHARGPPGAAAPAATPVSLPAVPDYRTWEDLYRQQWTWDRVARGTHSMTNCVSGCAWDLYVKDDMVWREEQKSPDTASASTAEPARSPERARKARTKRHPAETREEQPEDSAPPPAPADSTPAVQPVAEPAPAPPPPPQPRNVQIPAGTTVTIRMIDGVDSSVNHAGEIFHASLEAPLVVGNEVVVPKGADIYVRLVSASSAGHMTGKSELHLELIKMEFQGRSYPLVSSTYSLAGDSRGTNTAKKVGAGAVIGTLIGAIAGGGKGAAIGAGVGAAGGGVYQAATKGKQVRIPSETKLDFQLDQPVTVTVMPRSGSVSE